MMLESEQEERPENEIILPPSGKLEETEEVQTEAPQKFGGAPVSHLANPVLIQDDGSSRVIKLHTARSMDTKRIKDLIKSEFNICKIAEIDGFVYAICYSIRPTVGYKPNVIASFMLQNEILGPVMLLTEAHGNLVDISMASEAWMINLREEQEQRKKDLAQAEEEAENGSSSIILD